MVNFTQPSSGPNNKPKTTPRRGAKRGRGTLRGTSRPGTDKPVSPRTASRGASRGATRGRGLKRGRGTARPVPPLNLTKLDNKTPTSSTRDSNLTPRSRSTSAKSPARKAVASPRPGTSPDRKAVSSPRPGTSPARKAVSSPRPGTSPARKTFSSPRPGTSPARTIKTKVRSLSDKRLPSPRVLPVPGNLKPLKKLKTLKKKKKKTKTLPDDRLTIALTGFGEEFVKYVPLFNEQKITVDQLLGGELQYSDYVEIGIEPADIKVLIDHFRIREKPEDDDFMPSAKDVLQDSDVELVQEHITPVATPVASTADVEPEPPSLLPDWKKPPSTPHAHSMLSSGLESAYSTPCAVDTDKVPSDATLVLSRAVDEITHNDMSLMVYPAMESISTQTVCVTSNANGSDNVRTSNSKDRNSFSSTSTATGTASQRISIKSTDSIYSQIASTSLSQFPKSVSQSSSDVAKKESKTVATVVEAVEYKVQSDIMSMPKSESVESVIEFKARADISADIPKCKSAESVVVEQATRDAQDEISAELIAKIFENTADQIHSIDKTISTVSEELSTRPELLVQSDEKILPTDQVPIDMLQSELERLETAIVDIAKNADQIVMQTQAKISGGEGDSYEKVPELSPDLKIEKLVRDEEKTFDAKYLYIFAGGALLAFAAYRLIKR